MKQGQTYENIFSGTKVVILSANTEQVEYQRSPVDIDWTTERERITSFIKPREIFWQTYSPVDNLLPQK